jgi:hypothetical protein
VVLAEEPDRTRQRLQRLQRTELGLQTCLRLLEGRIQENDSPWLVELAWGPPQRRFMVNLFHDEEHFVYLRPGQEPVLLRFVGGRLGVRPGESLPAAAPGGPTAPASAPTSAAPVERLTPPR